MVNMAPLTSHDARLLRIIGRMALASAEELEPVVGSERQEIQERLETLRSSGWVGSTFRGMLKARQDRWLLAPSAVQELYATDHIHADQIEISKAGGRERLRDGHEPLGLWRQKFAVDHEHTPHLEDAYFSPFAELPDDAPAFPSATINMHEHPPWAATPRGQLLCIRRLAALEMIYQLAPMLFTSSQLLLDSSSQADTADLKMTDFRLLRHGGFYHAVARYAPDIWVTFTYLGQQVTERIVRRKQSHRYWSLDCYVAAEDRYLRAADRSFFEDPQYPVEPSAQVIAATDPWAAELARRVLVRTAPTLVFTPDGLSTEPVAARPSFDQVSDPMQHTPIGRNLPLARMKYQSPELEVLSGPAECRLFTAIAEFPAMQASWLGELSGHSLPAATQILGSFVNLELAAEFDGRYFLGERGMIVAANLSRIRRDTIARRHSAYYNEDFRQHLFHHDEGVNRLVLKFAQEGVTAIGGWRGELNLTNVTQIKPDLLILVSEGPFGQRPHCVEYERGKALPGNVVQKLGTYRKSAAVGLPVPVLFVCENESAARNFLHGGRALPLLATHLDAALTGPITGDNTVWRQAGKPDDKGVRLVARSGAPVPSA